MSKNEFDTRYLCVCNQSFFKKCQLRKHVSICKYVQYHDAQYVDYPTNNNLVQLSMSKCEIQSVNTKQRIYKDQLVEKFKCGCEKRFQSKGGYYRHIKKCKLRPEQQIVTGKTKCNEPGCLLTFKYIRDFRQHLNEKHEIQFDVEDKMFNRYSDFLCWKENYETETRSCFYHRKTETRSGRRIEYWYCNRSGIYQSASQGRSRKLKSQGILKINNNCTSSLTLTINKTEGTVQAIIHHTHYGHELELVHLRIPKSDKQEIASKLLQGVKVEDILSSYKEDGLSKQVERKHLIKRRDILNISKKYNVNILLPKLQKLPKKKKKNESVVEINESLHNKESYQNTNEIKNRHIIATQLLPSSFVSPIYDNVWRISIKNNLIPTYSSNTSKEDTYHVTKTDVIHCSNDCKTYYSCCNICNHSYSCTCSEYSSKNIICEHIHLVVLFQVTPTTSQYIENIENPINNNQDHTAYTRNCIDSLILTQPIECDSLSEYNISENNDYVPNIQYMNLENIKMRLEKLMKKTLKKVNGCNNRDLLENIEKQITNITFDLDTNLLQK